MQNEHFNINRTDKKIIVRCYIEPKELLKEITADEVVEYYKSTKYELLDKIGREYCMEYFNLRENPDGE